MLQTANPKAAYQARRQEIDQAMAGVLEGGSYILGQNVEAFEGEFAAFAGVGEGVGVGSGTDALSVALRAHGVGAGDEVITVSHTAVATVAAIEAAGAAPVLVDVEPDFMTMDAGALEGALGPKVKVILPVHLYGQPADMDPILEAAAACGAAVIEDCAQAHGARYRGRAVGSLGATGCFSFYPTKNLGALGDGGMVVTDDAALAGRARGLRQFGWQRPQWSEAVGVCSRLDELQAAVLRVKLRYLGEDNATRRTLAGRYGEALADTGLGLPVARGDCDHAWHLYVVRCPDRDALAGHLNDHGIAAGIHYPAPVHRQPAYQGRLRVSGELAVTEALAASVLSLPIYPELGSGEQDQVIDAIRGFFGGKG